MALIRGKKLTKRIIRSHRYANIEKKAVIANTSSPRIFLTSPLGITETMTADIINRLKAADPTMVLGPREPAWKSGTVLISSMRERRISGAELPRAISVRFDTVSFHTRTSIVCFVFGRVTFRVTDVITYFKNTIVIQCEKKYSQ